MPTRTSLDLVDTCLIPPQSESSHEIKEGRKITPQTHTHTHHTHLEIPPQSESSHDFEITPHTHHTHTPGRDQDEAEEEEEEEQVIAFESALARCLFLQVVTVVGNSQKAAL